MKILAILVISVLSSNVLAASNPGISTVPFNQCDWSKIFVMAHFKTVSQRADTSKDVIRLYTEIKAISSTVPDPKKPIDEQLSKSDLGGVNK